MGKGLGEEGPSGRLFLPLRVERARAWGKGCLPPRGVARKVPSAVSWEVGLTPLILTLTLTSSEIRYCNTCWCVLVQWAAFFSFLVVLYINDVSYNGQPLKCEDML